MKALRGGLRDLLRAPAFTALAVFTLALGIGAATAMFSVVDAVLLRPLPYPGVDRFAQLWTNRQGPTSPGVPCWRLRRWRHVRFPRCEQLAWIR